MVRVLHSDRAVTILGRRTDRKKTRPAVELRIVRRSRIPPLALLLRHEPDLPGLVSVVEAIHLNLAISGRKAAENLHVGERVGVSESRSQRNFFEIPLLDALILGGGSRSAARN